MFEKTEKKGNFDLRKSWTKLVLSQRKWLNLLRFVD